jgi:hypothetical protein
MRESVLFALTGEKAEALACFVRVANTLRD